jgi:hypothetical protein
MIDQRIVIAVAATIAALFLLQSFLLWRLLRSLGTVQRLDEKLGHFGDALSLLTETTESGFHAVASELNRTPQDGAPATKKPSVQAALARASSARINSAARRGRTVPEIAAAEELSEGEVRLRLHLAKQAAQAKAAAAPRPRRGRQVRPAPQEQANGTVRA